MDSHGKLTADTCQLLKEGDTCICPKCRKNLNVILIEGQLGFQKHNDRSSNNCPNSEKSFQEVFKTIEKNVYALFLGKPFIIFLLPFVMIVIAMAVMGFGMLNNGNGDGLFMICTAGAIIAIIVFFVVYCARKGNRKRMRLKYILLFLVAMSFVIHGLLPLLSGSNVKLFSVIVGLSMVIIYIAIKRHEKRERFILGQV